MQLNSLRLSTKFTLSMVMILLAFCVVISLLLYYHLKTLAIEEAKEKSVVIMTQVGALGGYIKNTLRPRMFALMPGMKNPDEFVVEAMSTTHVTQEVMRQFQATLSHYSFRRASTNPLNPKNRADSLHEELIRQFTVDRALQIWSGIRIIDGQQHLVRARPIVAEKSCLGCHGDPADAPKGLLAKYGSATGFGWKEGEILGVETVTVSLADVLAKIQHTAIATFVFGFGTLLLLIVSLQGIFWGLVSRPLKKLSAVFTGIARGTEPLNQDLPIRSRDEIGELTGSFNQMARHLHDAQERMQENAGTLRSIFEGITDPLALVKPDCSVEITNQAYREWADKGISAVFTTRCSGAHCDPDTPCPVCFLEKARREKKAVSEYWEDLAGKNYYVHLYPILDENGEMTKAVHYVKDVTEKKQMEDQMRIAEKLSAMSQLSAGIAHEINNPLGGIRLCFNNLTQTAMDDETRAMHVDVINTGLAKIEEIIRQLLAFSRKTDLSVSPVPVNMLLENVLKLTECLVAKQKIAVERDLAPDLPEILADGNMLEQVFLNIILNAVQAMAASPERRLAISTRRDNGLCTISFEDTGAGIPDEVMPRIFDPFFSTKPAGEGTGLGLSVSRSIVEQHRGKITVESSPGRTTFTVRLPIRQ